MRLRTRTTFSAAIVGDDLVTALVSVGPLGVRARRGPVLHGARPMGAEESRRLLRDVPAGASVVLVVPASLAGVRPSALPVGRWAAAREEMVRSVGSLFPFPPEESAVGYIGRRTDSGVESGYVVAADRRVLRPWVEALERGLGRPVSRVISSHMALLGMGWQGVAEARAVERVGGAVVSHVLALGEVRELHATDDGTGGAARWEWPEDADADDLGFEAAVAGALAEEASPGRFAPLIGSVGSASPRWLAAAAALIGAVGLLWASGRLEAWRYDRAIGRLEAESLRQGSALADARMARERALESASRLESLARAEGGASWSALETLASLQGVLPSGAFLYRVEADAGSVLVKGEARRAGDVLRAVEESAMLQGAKETDTPLPVEERGLEMFSIRAERALSGKAAGP